MTTTIEFNEYPVGTRIKDQYRSRGLEFPVPGIIALAEPDTGPKILQPIEAFTTSYAFYIKGSFVNPTHSYVFMRTRPAAKLIAFASDGRKLAESTDYLSSEGYEVFSGEANIATFEIHFQTSTGSVYELTFDDVTGTSPPDFRMVYSPPTRDGVVVKPGSFEDAFISIVRLAGSHGPILLQATSLPQPGVFANVEPDLFVGASGQTVRVRFHALPFSDANQLSGGVPVHITGIPQDSSGTTIRQTSIPLIILEPYELRLQSIRVSQTSGSDRTYERPPSGDSVNNYPVTTFRPNTTTTVRVRISVLQGARRTPPTRLSLFAFRGETQLAESPKTSPFYVCLSTDPIEVPVTLPLSWTSGTITLKASIGEIPSSRPFTFEKSTLDNNLIVTGIVFL